MAINKKILPTTAAINYALPYVDNQVYGASESTGYVSPLNFYRMTPYARFRQPQDGATISAAGFYFGTDSNYLNNTKYTVVTSPVYDQYSAPYYYDIFGKQFGSPSSHLSYQTTYYITPWATNEAGTTIGTTFSRTTPAAP